MLDSAFIWPVEESLLVYAGLTFALLGLACEAGFWLGGGRDRRRTTGEHDREGVGNITDAMMGLMSFTLGLTIGYAQDRAEARRELVVNEA